MSSVRFDKLEDLFGAYPNARADIAFEAGDRNCLDFFRVLIEGRHWAAAISFCAYFLPRREAVWWGLQTLRRLEGDTGEASAATLEIVTNWVRDPDDRRRRACLERAAACDPRAPATWLAFAAGWSGGNAAAPANAHQTARAVRAALLIASSHLGKAEFASAIAPCLARGLEMATPA
jgi:hypothetical protein